MNSKVEWACMHFATATPIIGKKVADLIQISTYTGNHPDYIKFGSREELYIFLGLRTQLIDPRDKLTMLERKFRKLNIPDSGVFSVRFFPENSSRSKIS